MFLSLVGDQFIWDQFPSEAHQTRLLTWPLPQPFPGSSGHFSGEREALAARVKGSG